MKGLCHQREIWGVTCAKWASEPYADEAGLHLWSAFQFTIIMDSLAENTRNETHWQTDIADDVVLCAVETDVLEVELERWREAMEKRGIKVARVNSIVNTEYSCM